MSNVYDSRQKWSVLRGIWMNALKHPTDYSVECDDKAMAKRLRNELYAAGRRAKRNRTLDNELSDAAAKLAITIKPLSGGEIKYELIIYKRVISTFINKVEDSVIKDDANKSIDRLQRLLDKNKPIIVNPDCPEGEECDMPKNPYFNRED